LWHSQQKPAARPSKTFLATPLLALSSLIWEATMGQRLIADLSVSDIHFQAWVFLVAGIVLLWFLYALATRSLH
jgi:hypothetical protein